MNLRQFTTAAFMSLVVLGHTQTCEPPANVREFKTLAAGTLMEGIGRTDMPITSKSKKANQLAKQGFALIHCFWFNEAVRSFRDATKEDPTCAIAWCGLNISLTLPWNRSNAHRAEAEYAIKQAIRFIEGTSDVEDGVISAFRLRSMSEDDRGGAFEKKLNEVISEHPKVNEPRLLLAAIRTQLCLSDGYDEKGDVQAELKAVVRLIEPVLESDPNSAGAHHYQIHAFEGSQPQKALHSANILGKLAPKSSHMVHMPGHIYNRLGMYDKAHEVFWKSKEVDEAYFKTIPGADNGTNWNYGHNLDFLSYNLSEMGRIKEAVEHGNRNRANWRVARWDVVGGGTGELSRGNAYFRGMAAAEKGDLETAEKAAALLEAGLNLSPNARGFMLTRQRTQLGMALEVRGSLLFAQGKHEEGLDKLRQAVEAFNRISYEEPPSYVRPPHETYGHALIKEGKYAEAVKAFEDGLRARPNSGYLLYGIALAHEKAGDAAAARKGYEAFLKAWSSADPDLPMMVAAKAYLGQ